MIKILGALLLLTTLLAFVLALLQGPIEPNTAFIAPSLFSDNSVLFLIALMGWMPTAVDISTWNSLWTVERIRESGYKPLLKETLREFNLGYWISTLLAVFFVIMGSFMMYGGGQELSNNSSVFANQVVQIYTGFIGDWSYFIIAIAAFTIMFGTSIAVFDGYGRSMGRTMELIRGKAVKKSYILFVSLTVVGAFLVVYFFGTNMKELVDLATTISFLVAPFIAVVNFRLVMKNFPDEAKPGLFMRTLSCLGILFLTAFSIYYIFLMCK